MKIAVKHVHPRKNQSAANAARAPATLVAAARKKNEDNKKAAAKNHSRREGKSFRTKVSRV